MDKKDFFEDVNKENKKIASFIKEESDKTIIPDKMNSEELNGLLNKSNERKKQGKILKIGTIAACLALIVGVFNVTYNYITNDNNSGTFNVVVNEKNNETKSDNNESYSDIYDKLKNLQIANNAIYYGMKERNGLKTAKSESTNVADSSASSQSKSYNTNVQTQGVDEADIVKTNGKNIFLLNQSKSKVLICNADGENTKQVGAINLSSGKNKNKYEYQEMYVNDNRLVVFASKYSSSTGKMGCYDIAIYSGNTEILIYDITDIENVKLASTLKIEGNYNSSRLVGNILYTVTNKPIDNISIDNCVPYVQNKKMAASDIYIPENSDGSDYVIVTSVNILKPDKIMGTKAIAVGNTNVYMSEDNLYLCISKSSEEDISDTKEGKKYISKIDIKDKDVKIRKEYKKYLKKAYPDINFNEVYAKEKVVYVREKSNTEIIKIQCKDGNLKIIADGVVDGTIDDNLSVDEYKGHIRMVTTVNDYKNLVSRIVVYNKQDEVIGYEDIYNEKVLENDFYKNDMHNNLYVLDSGMKVVSKTEGLAENEEIYSARFMGDYGYFVTYRNTDPLFAVDFSDIENPSIIGKLKISGYSDYLHFYGEDSLLGLGMNTENENNQEIKLDMYNIKNGKAELESRKVISGTEYSEALYNYKAVMVSYEKNIIGFMAEEYKNGNIENYYYIFGYDKENEKFVRRAKIKMSGNIYSSRGLYIDDNLYVIGFDGNVIVLDMDNYNELLRFKMK